MVNLSKYTRVIPFNPLRYRDLEVATIRRKYLGVHKRAIHLTIPKFAAHKADIPIGSRVDIYIGEDSIVIVKNPGGHFIFQSRKGLSSHGVYDAGEISFPEYQSKGRSAPWLSGTVEIEKKDMKIEEGVIALFHR